MPKPNTGPRLEHRTYKSGRTWWVIAEYENGVKRYAGTGIPVGRETRSGEPETDPQAALAAYIAGRAPELSGPRQPADITVDAVLAIYGAKFLPADGRKRHKDAELERLRPAGNPEHRDRSRTAQRTGYAIEALLGFWRDTRLLAVRGETCRRYLAERMKEGIKESTVRRELGTLQAAINYCHREGYIIGAPAVWKPPKPEPKDRWLTRSEAARLLRAARRVKGARAYLPLFILIGLYTGTRKEAILKLQWVRSTTGGFVDLDRGVLYRSAVSEVRTRKRKPPAPIPARLLRFLRYARRRTARYVLEQERAGGGDEGPRPVADLKRGFASAAIRAGFREQRLDKNGEPVFEVRRDAKGRPRRDRYGRPVHRMEPGPGGRPQKVPAWRATISPHVVRHTCATWLMQEGVDKWDAAGFLGMSVQTLEDVYGHHHPDYMKGARDALSSAARRKRVEER